MLPLWPLTCRRGVEVEASIGAVDELLEVGDIRELREGVTE
jgi:hypothetical protein